MYIGLHYQYLQIICIQLQINIILWWVSSLQEGRNYTQVFRLQKVKLNQLKVRILKLKEAVTGHIDTRLLYLVLPTGGVAGLPLHGVVPDLRCLLVFGHRIISPRDTDRVRGQGHSLDPYWRDHGSAGVWHGSGVFIKEMEEVILRWIYGVWWWWCVGIITEIIQCNESVIMKVYVWRHEWYKHLVRWG